MSPVRELFRLAAAANLSLNGGSAPRRWRHELRRLGARLDADQRASRWVLDLADVLPALRDGPLWGDYLAQLVVRQSSPLETNAAPQRSAPESSRRASHRARPIRRAASVDERHTRAASSDARDKGQRPEDRLEDLRTPRTANNERARVPSRRMTPGARREAPAQTSGARPSASPISTHPTKTLPTTPEPHENSSHQSHGAGSYERHDAISESHTDGYFESGRDETIVSELPLRASYALLTQFLARGDLYRKELTGPRAAVPTMPMLPTETGPPTMTASALTSQTQAEGQNEPATASMKRMSVSREGFGSSGDSGGASVGFGGRGVAGALVNGGGRRASASSSFADRIERRAASLLSGSVGRDIMGAETTALLVELANRAGRLMRHGSITPRAAALEVDALTPLAAQWSLSLTGETAPQDLLSSLAVAALTGAASGGELEREKTAASSSSRPTGAAATRMREPHVVNSKGSVAAGSFETRAALAHDSLAAWPSQQFADGHGHAVSMSEETTDDAHASEELRQRRERGRSPRPEAVNALEHALIHTDARGSPAPDFPPLIPPQRADGSVLPVAVAAARRGARVEAQAASELAEPSSSDLDTLAEKIKLILDEQARRHGIDV